MRKLLILLLPIFLLSTQLSARADGVSFGIPLPFPFSILQLRPKLQCPTRLLRRILLPTVLRTRLLPSRILLRRLLSPKVPVLSNRLVRLQVAGLLPARRVGLLTLASAVVAAISKTGGQKDVCDLDLIIAWSWNRCA
jgi:hypothetical protein